MAEKIIKNKFIILLLITGAVYFFLKYISPLVAPLLAAILLVAVSVPFFDKIRKKIKVPRALIMGIFMVIIVLVLGFVLWFFVTKITDYLPGFVSNLQGAGTDITVFIRNCCNDIESRFGINADEMESLIIDRVNIFIEHFQANVMPGMVGKSVSYAKYVVSVVAFVVVTVIAVILLIKDYDKIMRSLKSNNETQWFLEVVWQVIYYIGTFLKAQLIIMLSLSGLCVVVLMVAGIDNGIVFGVLAGVFDLLPFIGTGIVLIPLAIWHLLNGWYVQAVVCLLLYAGCAILREMLEPKLIGDKVGIYPIAILLSVYAGLKLFGGWGIIKGPLGLVVICQIYNGWKEKYLQEKEERVEG